MFLSKWRMRMTRKWNWPEKYLERGSSDLSCLCIQLGAPMTQWQMMKTTWWRYLSDLCSCASSMTWANEACIMKLSSLTRSLDVFQRKHHLKASRQMNALSSSMKHWRLWPTMRCWCEQMWPADDLSGCLRCDGCWVSGSWLWPNQARHECDLRDHLSLILPLLDVDHRLAWLGLSDHDIIIKSPFDLNWSEDWRWFMTLSMMDWTRALWDPDGTHMTWTFKLFQVRLVTSDESRVTWLSVSLTCWCVIILEQGICDDLRADRGARMKQHMMIREAWCTLTVAKLFFQTALCRLDQTMLCLRYSWSMSLLKWACPLSSWS